MKIQLCKRVTASFSHQLSLAIDKYIHSNHKYTYTYCTNTNLEKCTNMKTQLCKRVGASPRHQLSLTDSRFCLGTASQNSKVSCKSRCCQIPWKVVVLQLGLVYMLHKYKPTTVHIYIYMYEKYSWKKRPGASKLFEKKAKAAFDKMP